MIFEKGLIIKALSFFSVRYHYEKPTMYLSIYERTYICDHPVYNKCTLFEIDNNGLVVIQQLFNSDTKTSYWNKVDPWLTDDLYLHPKFKDFFENRSSECKNGLYPTVMIRQIMRALKMKPIPKERWETCFDRRNI